MSLITESAHNVNIAQKLKEKQRPTLQVERKEVVLNDTVSLGLDVIDNETKYQKIVKGYSLQLPQSIPKRGILVANKQGELDYYISQINPMQKTHPIILSDKREPTDLCPPHITCKIPVFNTIQRVVDGDSVVLDNELYHDIYQQQFTIQPGTWHIEIYMPNVSTKKSQLKLVNNITKRAIAVGTNLYIKHDSVLRLSHVWTIKTPCSYFIIQHLEEPYHEEQHTINNKRTYLTATLHKLREYKERL